MKTINEIQPLHENEKMLIRMNHKIVGHEEDKTVLGSMEVINPTLRDSA